GQGDGECVVAGGGQDASQKCDCSTGVCASDHQGVVDERGGVDRDGVAGVAVGDRGDVGAGDDADAVIAGVAGGDGERAGEQVGEIGRASCRDRVGGAGGQVSRGVVGEGRGVER